MPGWERLRRRYGARATIFCVLSGGALIACGPVISAAPSPRAPEKIYASTCGYCHGQHVAPVIRGRALPPEAVVQFVRSGPAAMPAFRQTEISDAELKALAAWIHASKADPKEHDQ
jgi:mono/diheme cytochrome c family protein